MAKIALDDGRVHQLSGDKRKGQIRSVMVSFAERVSQKTERLLLEVNEHKLWESRPQVWCAQYSDALKNSRCVGPHRFKKMKAWF